MFVAEDDAAPLVAAGDDLVEETGPVDVDSRDAYLHEHLFVLGRGKLKQGFLLLQFIRFAVAHDVDYRVDNLAGEGFRKLHVESDRLVVGPPFGAFPTHDFGIAQGIEFHIEILLPLQAVVEVYDKTGLLAIGEVIAVHGGPFGGRQFGFDLVAVEHDRVVARDGRFAAVREGRGVGRLLTLGTQVSVVLFAYGRHQQNVAVVTAPGTAQVSVGKTVDCAVGVVVSRAGIPLVNAGIGTRLYHSVRNHCTGKRVSVTTRPDERIHKIGIL